jgi:hypothetical protein
MNIFIIHIILLISGMPGCHVDGVAGLANVVSFIWKYVHTAAITVRIMFFVSNKFIHKKLWLILAGSKY